MQRRTLLWTAAALLGASFSDLFLPVDSHGERQRTLPFLLTKQSKFDELPLRGAFEGAAVVRVEASDQAGQFHFR